MRESFSYFGSKNQLYQALINLIPRHDLYVEAFAGFAAVGRHLMPAPTRVFMERDPIQCRRLEQHLLPPDQVLCGDALSMLRGVVYLGSPRSFVFVDPPYPISDRRDPRPRYRCEMTDEQHQELIRMLKPARARVMVCGFPWGIYAAAFDGDPAWHRHDFKVTLRGGRRGMESVWCNYADPYPLHDYRYWGQNRKVRQDVRRLVSRTVSKIKRLDPHRRQAVLDAIHRDVQGVTR